MADLLFDAVERAQLSDLFDELGPQAPTLLAPWTTRDLAAHLVLRERDYLAGPGLVLPGAWGRLAERRRRALALRDFTWLSATIRSGPPPGLFRIGWVRRLPNLNEFFVHHEDVRRANGRGPRTNELQWTRPFGTTSLTRPGSSPGDCTAQDSSFSGREPLRPFEHGEANPLPASPDLQANCSSTSSADRAQHMSR
jgi:uncharacterized protein (TIGR03083 family)